MSAGDSFFSNRDTISGKKLIIASHFRVSSEEGTTYSKAYCAFIVAFFLEPLKDFVFAFSFCQETFNGIHGKATEGT